MRLAADLCPFGVDREFAKQFQPGFGFCGEYRMDLERREVAKPAKAREELEMARRFIFFLG